MSNDLLKASGGLLDEIINEIHDYANSLNDELDDVQLTLHKHPEIAWQENFAHDTLSSFMEKKGFRVTRHAFGLKTAWKAEYEVGSDGPIIGFNSESKAFPLISYYLLREPE